MIEILGFIVLLSLFILIPIETFSWHVLLMAGLETALISCFGYTQKKIILYFFVVSLLLNWCFNTYIDEFYQYVTPYLAHFDLKYHLDYFACAALFKLAAIFIEVILLSLFTRFTESLLLLVLVVNILSAVLRWGLVRWLS